MKIKLAILEHDRSYLTRIVAAFGRKYADKFEIYSFTSPEVALETLNSARIEVLLSGMMAVKYNGKYHYCNSLFEELFGAYDYAGSFYGGVAAVMEGDKWAIIGENGDQITDFIFEEIKLDDKGIAFRNGRAFAKINGSYMLIDANGKQVGKAVWDDVDAFNSDMIAAVMKDGKWGFVDGDGKVVVEYQYEMAQSFANGMAAVMVGEKWGYISAEDFEMKIQPAFHAARDFSSNGTAFVIDGERWRMLRIYRLT